MNHQQLTQFIDKTWEESIIPNLMEYIKIPCKSPLFDHDWHKNGYYDQALKLVTDWCQQQQIPGMKLEVIQKDDRTPVLYIEIPGQKNDETIMLYGHLDKQPEMTGWAEDLGPWKPVRKNEKLYGRGSADDGYAVFCALNAIKALQLQNIPHSRCVIIIETAEESGSFDLPFYMDYLKDRIGDVNLIIALDSGAGNFDQMWSTTSLRGVVAGTLSVSVLSEGVHSGSASGVVPSTFRIIRQLLSRIEDENTGEILLPELKTKIPNERIQQAEIAAEILHESIHTDFPFIKGVKPANENLHELLLDQTWKAKLEVVGADNIPSIEKAGNVLRPITKLKLSMRTPPNCDVDKAQAALKKALEENPPYGAKVTFEPDAAGPGWDAPALLPWLEKASEEASQQFFGKSAVYFGIGASIPFMGMLGIKYPKAQFLITGVLGPHSNAHGPNEFIHLEYAKKVTACVSYVIAKQFEV